ncbi:hypothetical protein BV898_08221 [Hypsibius exemplaris]|uniref:Uncharacterized protein n=1 Tax=Hypsibius exemplaris TaxID=2072580 RepID=A0A1W0WRE1_HYPEX|nr:hypothetical protein BV898_08221 [Hypsibius exemplaris]
MQRKINVDQDQDRYLGSSNRGISSSFDLGYKGGRSGNQWQSNWGQQEVPLRCQWGQSSQPCNNYWKPQQECLPLRGQYGQGGQQWNCNVDQDVPYYNRQQQQQYCGQQPCGTQCDYSKGGQQGWQQQSGLQGNWQDNTQQRGQWQGPRQRGGPIWEGQGVFGGQQQLAGYGGQQRGDYWCGEPQLCGQRVQQDWGRNNGGPQGQFGGSQDFRRSF